MATVTLEKLLNSLPDELKDVKVKDSDMQK